MAEREERMAIYVATYDLHQPDQDYEPLYTFLRSFKRYAHCIDSVWLLDTSMTPDRIRDGMRKHMHERDTILVIRAQEEAAWSNYGDCGNWILSENRRW
jgi:hypothetical protein